MYIMYLQLNEHSEIPDDLKTQILINIQYFNTSATNISAK